MTEMAAVEFKEISRCMRIQSGYIVCPCGAWNTRDDWHVQTFKNKCYSCSRNLFKQPEEKMKELLDAEIGNLRPDEVPVVLEYVKLFIASRPKEKT